MLLKGILKTSLKCSCKQIRGLTKVFCPNYDAIFDTLTKERPKVGQKYFYMMEISILYKSLWGPWKRSTCFFFVFRYFGPRVYPRGSLVIALVRWSVVRWSVGPSVNISETVHWFFLIFCMKLEHHKGTKVTEPDF